MVFPVRVLTKICMPPRRRRTGRRIRRNSIGANKNQLTEVEGGLLLDIVVGEGGTIFQLLASKDKVLLVTRDALLVSNLGLDIVNGVRGLNFEGNDLPRQSLDKDLHLTVEMEDEMEGRLLPGTTGDMSTWDQRRG